MLEHLDAVCARLRGHRGVELDADDVVTEPVQQRGDVAGRTARIQDALWRRAQMPQQQLAPARQLEQLQLNRLGKTGTIAPDEVGLDHDAARQSGSRAAFS